MEMGIVTVASITAICYLIAMGVKAIPLDNKWIPVVCGTAGGALGLVGLKCIVDFPATDPLTAVAVGVVSGLAATGANQVYKQLTAKTTDSDETK
jgi:hypothetical protein